MKKILSLLLTVLVALNCFVSCSYLDNGNGDDPNQPNDEKVYFDVPEDEAPAEQTVTQTNENGLKLEVTLHGYKSESLGKDFYVKNNEYFTVDVKLTNESADSVYQYLPTSCRESTPSHNHEISFDIANGDYKLHSSSFGYTCPEKTDVWEIKAGQSYEWHLKLAAGKPLSYSISDSTDGKGNDKKDEKDARSDSHVADENKSSQNGNVQFYESTYVISGGSFGSDFIFNTDSSSSSYYFVVGGNAVVITGMLPSDFSDSEKLRLYEEAIFTDNVCTFKGPLSFGYMKSSDGFQNDLSVSVPLSVDVVYVSPLPTAN